MTNTDIQMTFMLAYKCACMSSYTHAYIHTFIQTYMYMHLHIYTYTFMHAAYIQANLHAYNIYVLCIHIYMYAYIQIDSWMCMFTDTNMHTYIHIDIHGDLCMPNTGIQIDTHTVDKHAYLQYIHAYKVKPFSPETYIILGLSICTIFRFAFFQNFHTFGNMEI